ncbi:MAG TPA: aminotransferase class I/II-fold pyridoxal phosphate-dependent enzyme [candidate division WOR-3 bacterium]|uniref:Aminotransferase n=1 Tax=candidate division WOR-3 bacterium TaxID=2052148 RepID=A0A7V0T5Z5_UNCW3|nr:aminotransferase class I/II-fold pyridoxal phosphate-dependent enzyme [candidate division WOR-3 bacterium]
MKDVQARRLGRIPPYLFQELDDLKAKTKGDVIDLGEGSPDLPPPAALMRALERALKRPENHRYPSYAGKLETRQAVADWYRRRFRVRLDPATEVTMLIGSKEGVAHLIRGTCGPGDRVAYGDPAYPVYPNQARLAGATPVPVPLRAENDFLPDLDELENIAPRIKLLCLNYPANPTAAVAGFGFWREVIALARKYDFCVVNDCVYSELSFGAKPPSILQVPGAKEHCLEFHSLSKTFSIAGWRIGVAVGNPALVKALLRIKQNTDSGPFGAIQDAAAWALRHGDAAAEAIRARYRRRRDAFCAGLARHGWPVPVPEATFYVWTEIPRGKDDYAFTLDLLRNCRVVAAPGSGFGRAGRGYVRFALVQDEKRLRKAADRIGRWVSECR